MIRHFLLGAFYIIFYVFTIFILMRGCAGFFPLRVSIHTTNVRDITGI
jgi:hypothetical protein